MKIAINTSFGGFDLSHAAVMRYAKRKGFKLYAFVDARDAQDRLVPYNRNHRDSCIYYSKEQLVNGQIVDSAYFSASDIERNDPDLIAVIEELGSQANGDYGQLKIVDIPDNVDWEIDEHDGAETIHEKHREWS